MNKQFFKVILDILLTVLKNKKLCPLEPEPGKRLPEPEDGRFRNPAIYNNCT